MRQTSTTSSPRCCHARTQLRQVGPILRQKNKCYGRNISRWRQLIIKSSAGLRLVACSAFALGFLSEMSHGEVSPHRMRHRGTRRVAFIARARDGTSCLIGRPSIARSEAGDRRSPSLLEQRTQVGREWRGSTQMSWSRATASRVLSRGPEGRSAGRQCSPRSLGPGAFAGARPRRTPSSPR